MTNVDSRELRSALGCFATGVTVITACAADGTPVGVTSNSFNSVSLEPPLVLWSIARTSRSFAAFMEARRFVVHVLASGQQDLSNRFASKAEDKFAGADLEIEITADGVPILAGCTAWFECQTAQTHDGGDHVIIIGEVMMFRAAQQAPLLFHSGRYAQISEK